MDKIVTAKYAEKITRFIQRTTPVYVSVAASGFIEFVGFDGRNVVRRWRGPTIIWRGRRRLALPSRSHHRRDAGAHRGREARPGRDHGALSATPRSARTPPTCWAARRPLW